ncbi:YheC/YheD family protein [Paenibacillus sp. LMG 31456]|uniref:YheC/YheD family protein n=1 Tax=Paenibacillus foliorum TaxID=2654974 RepID=A0A972GVB1_9BACL|nr:YheC/YheD family protein [Paenibacillus foliorum]NOU94472.1 YheC/YheD family protein [Paenibacillus foliorum]
MRRVANKWSKFAILLRHQGVAKHIPAMRHFSASNLRDMLQRYPFVVAKPFVGTGGNRVVKVQKTQGGYMYHYYGNQIKVHSLDGLVRALNRIRNGRSYMLQQGIQLTTIDGRPVDYRVKLVKAGRSWHIRAIVGRLARPGLFVTNLCKGGTLLQGSHALRRTFPARMVKSKRDTMCGVARTCTFLLESRYPGIGELGYDFGIDKKGSVWILEVNTRPH